jgi:hypothetical protein
VRVFLHRCGPRRAALMYPSDGECDAFGNLFLGDEDTSPVTIVLGHYVYHAAITAVCGGISWVVGRLRHLEMLQSSFFGSINWCFSYTFA